MAVKKQISIVLQNRIGTLNEITTVLSKKKVNILACCIHGVQDFGIFRIVVDNPGQARRSLKSAKMQFSATDVITAELPHAPGALALLTKKLARGGINIEYAYACAAGDKALGVFKVSETGKADRIISKLS